MTEEDIMFLDKNMLLKKITGRPKDRRKTKIVSFDKRVAIL